jgi:antitoxin ParD1/3/4
MLCGRGQGFSQLNVVLNNVPPYLVCIRLDLKLEAVMNVKISIELPENQLEFAERMVREGNYASVSEIMQEHVRDLMLAEHDKTTDDPVMAMKEEIRRRLETPDDQWLNEEEFWKSFEERRQARRGK